MIDQLGIEVAKQVPALAVLCWLVVTFLRRQAESETREAARDTERHEALQRLGDSCHEAQRSIASRYENLGRENIAALKASAEATTLAVAKMRELSGEIHGRVRT